MEEISKKEHFQYVEICNEHGYCVVKIVPSSTSPEKISPGIVPTKKETISLRPRDSKKTNVRKKFPTSSLTGFHAASLTLTTDEDISSEEEDSL